jgi:ATP-binding cassette, subfamily A (ABC1), member 3
VLFDELTVREHLEFFCILKGLSKTEVVNEVNKYLQVTDLSTKSEEMSCNLSGGMKRKLCLANALCGGSKFILIDEVSSGVDPAGRRDLWNLLLREKRNRTILMSTHYMLEAEVVADRIAVISKGVLKTVGSSFTLRNNFCSSYSLRCKKMSNCDSRTVIDAFKCEIPRIEFKSESDSELCFEIDRRDMTRMHQSFKVLEEASKDLGIENFDISSSSLLDVLSRYFNCIQMLSNYVSTMYIYSVEYDQTRNKYVYVDPVKDVINVQIEDTKCCKSVLTISYTLFSYYKPLPVL